MQSTLIMSSFAILLFDALLLAGVVVIGALLSNRHTRGFAMFGLTGACIVGGAVALWLFTARMESREQIRRAESVKQMELLVRDQMTHQGGSGNGLGHEQINEAHTVEVEPWDQLSTNATPMPLSPTRDSVALYFYFGPFVLLAFLAVLFLAFKHGGPGIGLTVLAAPLLLVGFTFVSSQSVPRVAHSTNTTTYPNRETIVDQAWDHATRPRILLPPKDSEVEEVGEKIDVPSDSVSSDDPLEVAKTQASGDDETVPEWITTPPKRIGNVYRRVLEAGPYATIDECQQNIEQPIYGAVLEYLRSLADSEEYRPAKVAPLEVMGISPRYIRENIVADEYYKRVESSVSNDMKTLYVLLEFDRHTTDDLLGNWRAYERRGRIAGVATIAGGVLAALAGVLGLVRLDTYTKGYYTKRLFIGVPLAIIGVVLLAAMIAA